MNHEQVIQIGGQTFLRVPVTATLRRADVAAVPVELVRASQRVAEQLHWQDERNPDLVYVQFVLDIEGANAN